MRAETVVICLLETPFSRRSDINKQQIITDGRPTPLLTVLQEESRTKKTRTFQLSWYNSHKWLCGSIFKQRLFCWPCLLLGTTKNVWSNDGYIDFKNISRSAKMHLISKDHIKNSINLKRLQNNTATILDALQEGASLSKVLYNEDVRLNRLLMTNLIDVTLLLGKQELAFRGHDETSTSLNRGNFREFFTVLIKRNEELTKQLEKHAHVFCGQSKTIQNELIYCVSDYTLEYVKNELKDVNFIGLIVDDTTDIVEKSQCAITIRYVRKNGDLCERFLGFHDVSNDRSANALFELVTSVLEPYDYKDKLIAQSYDGASVMAGEINGLKS
ncbi:zinc finger MYM-type protein 1-like [Photinus pyralis]|uniref:zinc finger MYM-type protein 1-like n=1 Tax=Photinus pyralis TaxID=7054 RepID=UPI0012674B5E|nr:zinc finger MYM-type protein 1-like [Photinus pyralis]